MTCLARARCPLSGRVRRPTRARRPTSGLLPPAVAGSDRYPALAIIFHLNVGGKLWERWGFVILRPPLDPLWARPARSLRPPGGRARRPTRVPRLPPARPRFQTGAQLAMFFLTCPRRPAAVAGRFRSKCSRLPREGLGLPVAGVVWKEFSDAGSDGYSANGSPSNFLRAASGNVAASSRSGLLIKKRRWKRRCSANVFHLSFRGLFREKLGLPYAEVGWTQSSVAGSDGYSANVFRLSFRGSFGKRWAFRRAGGTNMQSIF